MAYATIDDMSVLFRPLTSDEIAKANALIPVVEDSLRMEAIKIGKDLDNMLTTGKVLPNVLKSVVVDVVARTLMTSTNSEPMTQMSQSAMGYTVSGTYLVPGGGLFIKKAELAKLGIRRQRVGVIDLWD